MGSLVRKAPTWMDKVVRDSYTRDWEGSGFVVYYTERWFSVTFAIWDPATRQTLHKEHVALGRFGLVDVGRLRLHMLDALRKLRERSASSESNPTTLKDDKFVKDYPTLWEFLTTRSVDGTPRQPSTLTVFADLDAFKCFLNDRDTGLSLCVTADAFLGLLRALERALVSPEPGWRPIGGGKPQGKKPKRN